VPLKRTTDLKNVFAVTFLVSVLSHPGKPSSKLSGKQVNDTESALQKRTCTVTHAGLKAWRNNERELAYSESSLPKVLK